MKKLFYILLICLIFSSCIKTHTHHISQENKEYFLFDVGSYWIFQDSATLEIDSMVVTNVEYRMWTVYGNVFYYDVDCYGIDLDIFRNGIKTSNTGMSIFGDKKIDMFLELFFKYSHYYYFGGSIGKTHYFDAGSAVHYKAFYESYFLHDSLTVYDVKLFSNGDFMSSYWARDVGPVRFEGFDDIGAPYNLIRYNTKPYNNNK
jgi:hypothetical protein